MIDRKFWEEARKSWVIDAPSEITGVKTGSGGEIDPSLLKDPWDREEVPFDMVDYDNAFDAVLIGQDIPIKRESDKPKEPEVPPKPRLDTERFDALIEKQNIPDYVEACKLLKDCELPSRMSELYGSLIERLPVLQDAIIKFESVYQADMSQFYEYYIPEALQLTSTYIEYLDVGIGDEIISQTEKEVIDACDKLLIAVNDKIDEIYKFASIEIKAKAKALESMMSQDGYVDPDFKISKK